MRHLLAFAFLLALSLVVSEEISAEPEVYMVSVSPASVDNQADEDVNFEGDCSVCNEEELDYFYWNSTIDGVISSGSSSQEINFVASSSIFSVGDHEMILQVKGNGSWSVIDEESTALLNVKSGDGGGGGDGSIDVNFEIFPPTVHLGETAIFRSCTDMEPEPQPCVSDPGADLDYDWKIQWNNEGDWVTIGYTESFEYNNFEEGTHTVSLVITNNDNGEVSDPEYLEFIVLPPIPVAVIEGPEEVSIKEGQSLEVSSHCEDNDAEVIDCDHNWEIWEYGNNGDLLFELTGKEIVLDNLTNQIGRYDVMLRTVDDVGTYSQWDSLIVEVLPPNESPSASITISPQSLGGLTPEYYQYANLSFSSLGSDDPDGDIVSQKWWYNNDVVSEDAVWVVSFGDDPGPNGIIYQVKLEVQDDDGVWSSKVSTNFKIISNTPPTVDFTISSDEEMYTFNSTVSDAEGSVVLFEWWIGDTLISNEQNTTWAANVSGTFVVTLVATDDGGLSTEVQKTFEVKIAEQKNFVVTFGSKNIDVADTFTMDFSGTSGSVTNYEITVFLPNGTSEEHTTNQNEFAFKCDQEGEYLFDIVVNWADGSDFNQNTDFYTTRVNVGDVDDGSSVTPSEKTEPIDEGLPSLSPITVIISVTILAISRRQR